MSQSCYQVHPQLHGSPSPLLRYLSQFCILSYEERRTATLGSCWETCLLIRHLAHLVPFWKAHPLSCRAADSCRLWDSFRIRCSSAAAQRMGQSTMFGTGVNTEEDWICCCAGSIWHITQGVVLWQTGFAATAGLGISYHHSPPHTPSVSHPSLPFPILKSINTTVGSPH